jgi:DNA/RNA endonuclease G (NUC1)
MKKLIIILLFSLSASSQIVQIQKTKFVIYYDISAKLPVYTRDTLNTQVFTNVFTRKQIKRDNSVLYNYQARHKDYRKDTLFDKGHLVPIINVNYSQSMINEINVFTNIAPQYYVLNRGLWRDLELHIKNLYLASNTQIVIWSGCDFGYRNIGNIKIPLRFWKLILINGNFYAWQFENKYPLNYNFNAYQISPLAVIAKINSYGFEEIIP